MDSLSFFLAGLTPFLYGLAIAFGVVYPRWVGSIAVVSGTALMFNGAVVVAYEGFVPSIVKLAGLLLLAVWVFVTAFSMWRMAGVVDASLVRSRLPKRRHSKRSALSDSTPVQGREYTPGPYSHKLVAVAFSELCIHDPA